ncbi:uncharacterized protein LOC127567006 isoform X2 [Pristis pectinata]|uniref:uncharacterized protein LOC127567006 isoform X2 n=1 Tax=Pristis pectinata TaxID=685728 RepID=UPI00223DBBB1|nr:uncharacterized protein LOC127567006 isoform X2 [Pristis pectinata]
MAAALRKANLRSPVAAAPRNERLTHKARSVKLAEANKENCPEPVRPEKGIMKRGSRLPVPVKKFKVKSVPDFKKLHQNWDRNFQKKQTAAKKACTQPVPFNFATSRGAKSTGPVSTNQTISENTLVLSLAVTKEQSPESEEHYLVGAKCVMADTDPAAVDTIPIQNQDSGELLLQDKRDFGPSNSSQQIVQSMAVKKEKHFGLWQTSPTPSKTKSSNVQNSAQEIKPSSPVKEKKEILQNETIKPKAGNSDGDFVGNPMALQSILSNVGIDAFNIINNKPSLANGVSVKKNIQNPEPSNLNPGNNKSMALGNALSTVDDRNTFGILCGKSSMIIQAPAKDSLLHCKHPAQNPFVMGRSSYMPCNRPALPLALGRASCIAKLDTKASEISSPNTILQPFKLYNQMSSRHHFSSKKSARCKPDGPNSNLMEGASESSSCAASTLDSAGASCTWKPDTKTLDMQTTRSASRPSNCPFSGTRTPSENLWHLSRTLAPPSSVDQVVLRLFSDPEDPNEVEKAPETPSLKQESEGPKSQESPALRDLKLEKLKKIELLTQLLQREIQEVKVIEETLTESSCDASVAILSEGCPNRAGVILKSSPIATALKQQEAEGCVLPSDCTEPTSNQTPTPVDCSKKINSVSGAANELCTIKHQSEILLPSTELPLNVLDTLPTPVSCSSARLLPTAQGLKFQSPFCSGNTGRGSLYLAGMKRRFGETRPGCRKRFQETLLDEEVSCCFAHVILPPDGRKERSCTNPVAKILQQQEVMHFVPIELPPCITSQKSLQQFLLSVQEEQESPPL